MSTIIFRSNGDPIVLDAAVRTNRQFTTNVTSHPVELSDEIAINQVTDNVITKNPSFTVEGIISNAGLRPLTERIEKVANIGQGILNTASAAASFIAGFLGAGGVEEGELQVQTDTETAKAYNDLKFMVASKEIFTLQFSDEVIRNCVIQSLTVPRDAANSIDALRFTMQVQQIRIVNNASIKIDEAVVAEEEAKKADSTKGPSTENGQTESLDQSQLDKLTSGG